MRNYFLFLLMGIAIGASATLITTKRNVGTPNVAESPVGENRDDSKPETNTQVCPICETSKNVDLLPPPAFAIEAPKVFETNQESEVMVNWQAVDHASRYRIVLSNASGARIKTFSTKGLRLYLRGIPRDRTATTTEYNLHMVAINSANLEGPPGEARKLIVRGKAKIQAPAFKTIRIEE